MKSFLKFTLATIVGIIVSALLLTGIGLAILFAVLASDNTTATIPPHSVLKIDLSGTLVERSEDNPLDMIFGDDEKSCGLDDILSAIRCAKDKKEIVGIYLQASSLSAGFASLEEIRRALEDFKTSGKFIVAYADNYSQKLYYLSSVADRIWLNPKGAVEWRGLASQPLFYKDLLDKIGVEVQVFKVGSYKSAVEPYISTEMSPANREQVEAYLGSIWSTMLTDVSASRGLSTETLDSAAERMLMFLPAEESVACGLVDSLFYKNEVRDLLASLTGAEADEEVRLVAPKDLALLAADTAGGGKSSEVVAFYYAYGDIDNMTSFYNNEGISSDRVVSDLRKLEKDDDVKAVVLRVNSPGGSAFGSEQIWQAVGQLRSKKPVVVSMGDYAASGGYYISCGADAIVAEATTLTGSIGIFGLYPNAEGLAKKIGISSDVVKNHTFADFGAVDRPMRADEKNLLQLYIDRGYDLFLTRCSEGRGIAKERLDSIAQGRVWTGSCALELGLVDELGGPERALALAAEKAGLTNYKIECYPEKEDFLASLLKAVGDNNPEARQLQGSAHELYRPLLWLKHYSECDPIQARLPFEPNVY